MKTPDLEYINTGLFTRFMPNTKAGEDAWPALFIDGDDEYYLFNETGNYMAAA